MRSATFSVSLAVKDIGASRAFYGKARLQDGLGDSPRTGRLKNEDTKIGLFQGMFPATP